ncbi:MAG: aminoacyl-tRNA deacylase [Myxococcaceae bacterium]|nr:aminoacyl-tRNA deacylase [Myxococcaceae bacterium]
MADKIPTTMATRMLDAEGVQYVPRPYRYEERGGTAVSSRELGVSEHDVVKTLVMEDEKRAPLIVLMHGDCEVSTKTLARLMGVKSVSPCRPEVAEKHSGYQVGGTSPFGTKRPMPVYLQKSVLECARVYINGGHRGFLVELDPNEIVRVLKPTLVDVALPAGA